jgi:hypothetical protein
VKPLLQAAASFAIATAFAVVVSGMLARRGGILSLLVPPIMFAGGGYLAGYSVAGRSAAIASAIGLTFSGMLSLLAIVSTQAVPASLGWAVAFGVVWSICGISAAVGDSLSSDSATRWPRFLVIMSTFAVGGLIGGSVCLVGLTHGGGDSPLVNVLLVTGCAIPPAIGGASLRYVLSATA